MSSIIENNNESVEDINPNDDSDLKFEHMGLNKNILRGIFAYGYEIPSPIQRRAIPIFLKGKDIIAQARLKTLTRAHVRTRANGSGPAARSRGPHEVMSPTTHGSHTHAGKGAL